MRKLLGVGASVALVGVGGFASTSVGQSGDPAPLTDRPVVQAAVERATPAQARAAGAIAPRAKKKKGPKVSYYIQSTPLPVAAGSAAELVGLTCPGKRKVVSGYFQSSGGVVSDYFSRSNDDFKTWLFGFVNLTDTPQQAIGAIVCMTKV
jgi:hypothetical protein